MSNGQPALEAALRGEPWAFTGVIAGIDHIRDDNGRPLGERRAPADSRRDVSTELVTCPYHDERHGKLMNRPALEPTMRQFAAVGEQVAAFHAALPPGAPSWLRMLWAVLDQFAAPARYLLLRRQSDGPVPAALSAGHKLAAGYFGALLALLREQAAGRTLPEASAESFATFVSERGALIGASEVCAGPPHNIRVLTRFFVHGGEARTSTKIEPLRLELARGLADQVRLGVAWAVFDELTERALLLKGQAPRPLSCRTAYLADRLETRAAELLAKPAPTPDQLAELVPPQAPNLGAALAMPQLELATASELAVMSRVLELGDAAITLTAEQRPTMARRLANLLARYRLLVQTQWHLEQGLRRALGYAPDAGFLLTPILCPRPRSLEWLDVLTGHHLECAASEHPTLTLHNHRRTLTFE